MKAFLAGMVFLILVGVGGYFWLKYHSTSPTNTQSFQTAAITRTGTLQKSSVAGADFTHVIVSEGNSWGVASYSLHLDDYIGKKVEATGQNSGTTLYIDSIKVVE